MNEQKKFVAIASEAKDTAGQAHAKKRVDLALCTPHGLTQFEKCSSLLKVQCFFLKFITFKKSSQIFTKTFMNSKKVHQFFKNIQEFEEKLTGF